MHSPADNIVSINNAEKIYKTARHPKSFMSLDNADHLLSKARDARYVADTIAAWARRYLTAEETPSTPPKVARGHGNSDREKPQIYSGHLQRRPPLTGR